MELSAGWFLLCAFALIGLAWWLPAWRRRRRLVRPLPSAWRAILEQRLPVCDALDDDLKRQLHRNVAEFLNDKTFYGCGGLEVTDEMRVTIAAEACLLLLNRAVGVYPAVRFILVYPGGFVVPRREYDASGVVSERDMAVLGEAWDRGKVILSWDDVDKGVRDFADGHNVVLHEFAHQLDAESGSFNGAPPLSAPSSYRSWARVLGEEYEHLRRDALAGHRGLMDHYGATNPAEFFAVATEAFFERPRRMAREHPALFQQLAGFYRIDPRSWQRWPSRGAPAR